MENNRREKMPKNSEDRAMLDQTHGYEESIHKYDPPPHGLNNGLSNGSKDEESSMEVTGMTIDKPNDRPSDEQSEMCSTPEANYQRRFILQSSSVIERSWWKDPSVSPSPFNLKGLKQGLNTTCNRKKEMTQQINVAILPIKRRMDLWLELHLQKWYSTRLILPYRLLFHIVSPALVAVTLAGLL